MDKYINAVEKQLLAYNNKDVEEFVKWYTDDIILLDIDEKEDKVICKGKKAMIERYANAFKNSYLHCDIKNRMILGSTIIDYEHITFNENNDTFDAIAIYDINENGLIQKTRFTKGRIK